MSFFHKITSRIRKTIKVFFESSTIYPNTKYAFHNIYFSQDGEDVILREIFKDKASGFYVDVGAYHPQKFSNTYFFYLKGWRGINMDARPGSMNIFNKIRPNDVNLEIPISDKSEVLTYYEFDEPALNSFSSDLSYKRNKETKYKIIAKTELKTQTLESVLDENLPIGQTIDFLNIDIEGLDFQALISNNWSKYQPKVILIEDLDGSSFDNSKTYSFLIDKGYILIAKTLRTLIFKLKDLEIR